MPYGFDGSIGFSRASAKAARRAWLSSAESVEDVGGCEGDSEGDVESEAEERFRRDVSSRSWASRESVMLVDVEERESVRFTSCWKARRSCFFFAEREELESAERIDLACVRRVFSFSLGSSGSASGSAAAGETSSARSVVSFEEVEVLILSLRPSRRSSLSFGAPVAKRTRSGST